MLCECGCEHEIPSNSTIPKDTFEKDSDRCHNKGDLMCGICACKDDHFGKECECSIQNGGQNSQAKVNDFACRRDNTSTTECSGRGTCECNTCVCQERENNKEVNFAAFLNNHVSRDIFAFSIIADDLGPILRVRQFFLRSQQG